MVSLLDANVLVALFDPAHLHHDTAHDWFAAHRESGWASCPITENAVLRILSNPAYPGRRTTLGDAAERLGEFCRSGDHVFWPDDLSACDGGVLRVRHVQGHRQLTDAYLLALATGRSGRLATFDRTVAIKAVPGAKPRNLMVVA